MIPRYLVESWERTSVLPTKNVISNQSLPVFFPRLVTELPALKVVVHYICMYMFVYACAWTHVCVALVRYVPCCHTFFKKFHLWFSFSLFISREIWSFISIILFPLNLCSVLSRFRKQRTVSCQVCPFSVAYIYSAIFYSLFFFSFFRWKSYFSSCMHHSANPSNT